MNKITFLSVLFLMTFAKADFDFMYSESSNVGNQDKMILSYFNNAFSDLGYKPLNGNLNGALPELFVDQIYQKNESYVFLKLGLKTNKNVENRLIDHPDGKIYHFTELNTNAAFFFYQLESSAINKVITKFKPNKISLLNLVISKSYGQSSQCHMQNAIKKTTSSSEAIALHSFADLALKCAVTALGGAKDQLTETVTFFKTLFSNPSKMWSETIEKFKGLIETVKNLRPEIENFIKQIKSLNSDQVGEILCNMIGSAVVGALLGGGIAKLGVFLLNKIQSFQKVFKIMNKLKNKSSEFLLRFSKCPI